MVVHRSSYSENGIFGNLDYVIMCCITLVKYMMLMNGQPRGNISPERGLCQGEPLYPFIFILCIEVLVS